MGRNYFTDEQIDEFKKISILKVSQKLILLLLRNSNKNFMDYYLMGLDHLMHYLN